MDLYVEGAKLENSDPIAAKAFFERARDAGPIPIRAPTAAVQAVREVAASTDAILVDAEAQLPRAATVDLPSPALFNDAVHFNANGHLAMAQVIAPMVLQALQDSGDIPR